MFLYTICPSCKSGYDLTDLMRGKKLRCKACARPFNVTAAPRPRHLPPLMPFAQPGPAVNESRLPADAIAGSPLGTGKPSEPPTYINAPPVVKLKRPIEKPGARHATRQAASSGSGWWGRGGAGGIVFLIIIGIRICAGINRTTHQPAPVQRPPMVQPLQQFPPPANFDPNQGRDTGAQKGRKFGIQPQDEQNRPKFGIQTQQKQ